MKKLNSTKILTYAKKIKAIRLLGGKCKFCNDKNIFHLVFHHYNEDKENTISHIKDYRWSYIEKELKNCELLCHNCHNELHFNLETVTKSKTINKKLYLEYKNMNGCEICGYSKSIHSLHFHHFEKNDKDFSISKIRINSCSLFDLKDKIMIELDKCQVLCSNCHNELHTDKDFFEKNKNDIFNKIENMKEKSFKIDKNLVKKMYLEENKKQKEIAEYFKCEKSTISDIIKKLNINKEKRIEKYKDQIIIMYKNGLTQNQISKEIGFYSSSVSMFIKKLKENKEI